MSSIKNSPSANAWAKELNSKLKEWKDWNEAYKGKFRFNIYIILLYLVSLQSLKSQRKSQIDTMNKSNAHLSKSLEKEYHKCQEWCEKRMSISNEVYFLLDSEIKKCNSIIDKLQFEEEANNYNTFSFQNYMIQKHNEDTLKFYNYLNSKKKSKNKKTRNFLRHVNIKLGNNISDDIWKSKKNKNKTSVGKRGKTNSKTTSTMKGQDEEVTEDNLEDITYKEIDGKIGNTEQVYCFCNYISYGNMIKCDNPKCKREWFHFHCVGLKVLPKGKWFCSEKCAEEYKKEKKKLNNS